MRWMLEDRKGKKTLWVSDHPMRKQVPVNYEMIALMGAHDRIGGGFSIAQIAFSVSHGRLVAVSKAKDAITRKVLNVAGPLLLKKMKGEKVLI